jgi:hypothetical protein
VGILARGARINCSEKVKRRPPAFKGGLVRIESRWKEMRRRRFAVFAPLNSLDRVLDNDQHDPGPSGEDSVTNGQPRDVGSPRPPKRGPVDVAGLDPIRVPQHIDRLLSSAHRGATKKPPCAKRLLALTHGHSRGDRYEEL